MTFKDAILAEVNAQMREIHMLWSLWQRPRKLLARILRWVSLTRKGIPSHLAWVWSECSTQRPESIESGDCRSQFLCGCGWSVCFDFCSPDDQKRAEEDFAKHLAKIEGFC